jgi:hypothetical protein
MALSRREFQLVADRVSRLESQVRSLDIMVKNLENRLKGESITRILKEYEDAERVRKERESVI